MTRVLIDDVAEIFNGYAFNSDNFNTLGNGLPIARIRDVVPGISETYYSGEFPKEYILKNGDLLIGMDGEFNIANWKGGKALLNQRVCKVTPKSGIADATFLRFKLSVVLKEIEANTPFVTVKHLSSEELKHTEIEIPDLEEQHRTAALLDKADKLRRTHRYAAQLSETFLQAVFVQMFGDPRTNPMGWDGTTIDDVVAFSQYGTSNKSNADGKGYPVLGMGNLTYAGDIDLTKLAYVELSDAEFEELRLDQGDIIFNRTNSTELVGKTAKWNLEMDAVIASYLVRLKLTNAVLPDYFVALLNSKHFKRLFQERCKKAVGQSNISPTLLKEFPMMIPPLALQEKFARVVQQFGRLRAQQREADRQVEHLFQTLLHRAFSGEG